ncbi:MAG: hypothetical protein GY730_11240 [bacterium]|nr:hypothetical protein [bacterium]
MGINDYIKNSDEGAEKHCPDISTSVCDNCDALGVTVQVGKEILHPGTVEHSIKLIILYGVKDNKLEQLTVSSLGDENTVPRIKSYITKDKYQKLIATSYCNLHGLWENEISL